jgi:hypothetical protein
VTNRVDEEQRIRKDIQHKLEAIFDLLLSRNMGRVDVVHAGTNLVGVAVLFERLQKFHITLGGFNRDDISVETLDRRENVVKVEVRVAEVGMSLQCLRYTTSS